MQTGARAKSKPGSSTAFASQTGRTVVNLREMIVRGDFRPGERISELPLVARLGVSRTPIRLALDRLAHEGLLQPSPGGGFIVRAFTVPDIWDTIEIRGVLEGTAARLAAERLTRDRELAPLRKCQDEMDAMMPTIESTMECFTRFLDLNDAFHSAIADLSKSSMLRQALERVTSLPFGSASALVFGPSRLPEAMDMIVVAQTHHHGILEAIENRQGTRAEALAREHARLARRNLELALADKKILSTVRGVSLIKM